MATNSQAPRASLSRLLLTAGTLGLLTLSSPAVLAATGSVYEVI